MPITKGYKQLMAEADARINTLTLDEARARHGDPDVVFVDIRDIREVEREGMILDALPRGNTKLQVPLVFS